MDLSILIPVFNRLEHTRACLESLERTIGTVGYEVILIDDGSTDGTRDFLRTLPKPRYRSVSQAQPCGYACNINAAAKLANAPILCLLLADTVLMPGWLPPMLRVLRRSIDAGCVGNVQREPFSGLIDHIGITFDAEGLPVHAGKNGCLAPREEFARWPAVSCACALVRRNVFQPLGGFDEGYPKGFEDVDFCLRAAEAGYRHYVANRSSIYHYIGSSPARDPQREVSLQRYRQRWAKRYLAFIAQRDLRRSASQPSQTFSPSPENESLWREQWELGRRARQQHRQDILDARVDGRRYLRKHVARPWRYNFGRFCRALVQSAHPLPAAVPPPPQIIRGNFTNDDGSLVSGPDWALFDPPQP